jgi:hypothetical protein
VPVAASGQPATTHRVAIAAPAGSCPSPGLVARVLEAMAHDVRVVSGRAVEGATDLVVIVPEPGGFRVELGGHVRRFDEPRRRCDRRAGMAAVATALLLDLTPPPPSEPPGPPAAPPAADRPVDSAGTSASPSISGEVIRSSEPPRRPRLSLIAQARLAMGLPLGAPGLIAEGGAVRLTLGGRRWHGTLGVAVDAPAVATYPDLRVRILRAPLDIGLGLAVVSSPRFELSVEAGAWIALLRLSQADDTRAAVDRVDFGPRLALAARVRVVGPLQLSVLVEDDLSLAPTPVGTLHPTTLVGTTPRDWLAVGLGLAMAWE